MGISSLLSRFRCWYIHFLQKFLIFQGYPDFYPSKATEEEYILTEKSITDGFENKPIVAVISSLFHMVLI